MIAFLKTVGVDPPPQPPTGQTPEMAEAMARMSRNAGFFLAHRSLQIAEYTPDPQLLRALPGKIVIAAGDDSAGQVAHRRRSSRRPARDAHSTVSR